MRIIIHLILIVLINNNLTSAYDYTDGQTMIINRIESKIITLSNIEDKIKYIGLYKELILKHNKNNSLSWVLLYLDWENTKLNSVIKWDNIFETKIGKILTYSWNIITRLQWWADENYTKPENYLKKCWGNCWKKTSPTKMNKMDENYNKYFKVIDDKIIVHKKDEFSWNTLTYYPVDRIIIHHTATAIPKNKQDAIKQMKSIYKMHSLDLGWWDIGYNYLIDWEWNIYEWRKWWMFVVGNNVYWHDLWSVSIAMLATWKYSDKQLNSLKKFSVYLSREYNLDITKINLTRNYMLDWSSLWNTIIAHKELDSWKPTDPNIDMNIFRKDLVDNYLK